MAVFSHPCVELDAMDKKDGVLQPEQGDEANNTLSDDGSDGF